MKKILKSRRGVSSIISTLVIFTVMVSALGLAFSQIIPSLERFQTQSDLTAATNTFLSFDSEIKTLINTPDNSSSVLRYNLDNGILDLKQNREIALLINSGGVALLNKSYFTGEVEYKIAGNFKGLGGAIYDFGSPLLLVYSLNRTAQMMNIVHQTFDGYKTIQLYYSVFVSIEITSETDVEVNFMIVHLNTSKTLDGQGEYFPIVNTQDKIQIVKLSQVIESFNLGEQSDELSIEAQTAGFSQNIAYTLAPPVFSLTVNIIHINIDFRTV
jgi:hypothetical protein